MGSNRALLLGGLGAAFAAALLFRPKSKSAAPSLLTQSFGSALSDHAQLDVGVTETSENAGPRVDDFLATYGLGPANWCAAAVGTWIQETARQLGIDPPIPGNAGAKATMQQFQDETNPKVGWYDVDTLRAHPELVQPGMVPVWQRGPTGSWMGHIGIVSRAPTDGETFYSIEGNAGPNADRVVESDHPLSSPALLGMGYFIDDALTQPSSNTNVGFENDPTGIATFTPVPGVVFE